MNGSTLYPLATEPDKHWLAHPKGTALHSDRPEPDVSRSLTLDAIGPDDLGTIVHDLLTTAVEQAVPTDTLRRCAGPLATTLDATVAAQSHGSTRRERNQVTSYIRETVCPQFAKTDVWERLQASNAVYVEEPLDDVIHVAGAIWLNRPSLLLASRAPTGSSIPDTEVGDSKPDRRPRKYRAHRGGRRGS